MPTWICLLRAVNLGSHNKVPMAGLRDALSAHGFRDVRTYVQSGNVVLSSTVRSESKVSDAVRSVLVSEFDVDTPVLVRTPRELADVVAWDPFPEDSASRPQHVYVVHLDAVPDVDRAASVLAQDWSPDGLALRGRELVVRYDDSLSNSRVKQPQVLRRLGTDGTARNWRTLRALHDLT